MDHTYTKHQLLRMERKVLSGLKFNLSYCPPLHFLILFAAITHCSAQVVTLHICPFYKFLNQSEVLAGAVDGSLSTGTVFVGGSVCGVPTHATGTSSPLPGPSNSAGASNTRRGSCLVSSLQPSCWQVCIWTHNLIFPILNDLASYQWSLCGSTFRFKIFHPNYLCTSVFFSESVLLRIMYILSNAAAKAYTQETCATFIKYSSPETMHVSRHPGLKNASRLLGICTWHS